MRGRLWHNLNIKRYLAEIKVGIFFFFAFVLFFFTLLAVKQINVFKGTYILKVKFNFAEGLRNASPVRFCGVDVGEVKKVEVVEEQGHPVVLVFAKIQNDVFIPKNAYFFVNSLSLFGEKYLEITPSDSSVGEYLDPNETVEGMSPIPLFNVFATFTKTMEEISAFVKEGKLKTTFENALNNMEKASFEMRKLFEDIRNKQGTVGRFLYDDSLYEKTEEFLDDLKANPWKLLHKPKKR